MSILLFTDAAVHPVSRITAIGFVKVNEALAISQHAVITGKNATSQRAELYAIVYALRSLQIYPALDITVYTDCSVLVQDNTQFHRDNQDIVDILAQQKRIHNIEILWLRRKSHPYSVLAHHLAHQRLREHLRQNMKKRK